MWTIFKVFIAYFTILFLFYFFVSHETYGSLAPRSGIEPTHPALEGEVSATGPPGRSPTVLHFHGIKWSPKLLKYACPPVAKLFYKYIHGC